MGALSKRFKRWTQKMKIGFRLRMNRIVRINEAKARLELIYGAPEETGLEPHSTREKNEIKIVNRLMFRRGERQALLNRRRGKGNNSPYKLTGHGKDAKWEHDLLTKLAKPAAELTTGSGVKQYTAREIAESIAAQRWRKKPMEKQLEMSKWLKAHGRAEDWKRRRAEKNK